MAKNGYTCKCGFKVARTGRTRKQYAERKREHAKGGQPTETNPLGAPPCEFLAKELARTPVNKPASDK